MATSGNIVGGAMIVSVLNYGRAGDSKPYRPGRHVDFDQGRLSSGMSVGTCELRSTWTGLRAVPTRSFRWRESQRVQVGEQILDLSLRHYLAEARHHVAAGLDEFAYAFVIRRQPALRQELLLENSFQAAAFLVA